MVAYDHNYPQASWYFFAEEFTTSQLAMTTWSMRMHHALFVSSQKNESSGK